MTSSDFREFALQSDSFKDLIKPYQEEKQEYYYGYNKGEQHCDLPANWYSPETAFMIYSQVRFCNPLYQYIDLDEDQNGLITSEDLTLFSSMCDEVGE